MTDPDAIPPTPDEADDARQADFPMDYPDNNLDAEEAEH